MMSEQGRRAVLYCRVSTDAQERDGTSLDTQERACAEYATAAGWQLIETVRDAASGYSLDRPGIERVRRMLRDGAADVLVSYAVDRLSRNQNQIGVLFDEAQSAGARLEFVTEKFEDTAIGRFILAARAFIAEVEREKIAERTMRGKGERARSGKLAQGTGKGCYGYIYDRATGTRAIDPVQGPIVRSIFADFRAGTSIMAITNRLNADAIPTLTGKQWSTATVYHLLQNEAFTGRTVYRRTRADKVRDPRTGTRHRRVSTRDAGEWIEIDGATPAIIDAPTFAAAQARFADPARQLQGRRIYAYALSGRLVCRQCGRAMVGQTLQHSERFRYYRCRAAFAGPTHERCQTRYIRASDLEDAIRAKIAEALADERIIAGEYARQAEAVTDLENPERWERERARLEAQRLRLLKLYQLGEIDDAYLDRELATLRAKREALDAEADSTPTLLTGAPAPSREELRQACQRLRAWIAEASGDTFTLLLDALQIRIAAETDGGELTGVLPRYAPDCSHADVRPVVSTDRRSLF